MYVVVETLYAESCDFPTIIINYHNNHALSSKLNFRLPQFFWSVRSFLCYYYVFLSTSTIRNRVKGEYNETTKYVHTFIVFVISSYTKKKTSEKGVCNRLRAFINHWWSLKIVEESAENGMEMWTASVTMKKNWCCVLKLNKTWWIDMNCVYFYVLVHKTHSICDEKKVQL